MTRRTYPPSVLRALFAAGVALSSLLLLVGLALRLGGNNGGYIVMAFAVFLLAVFLRGRAYGRRSGTLQ